MASNSRETVQSEIIPTELSSRLHEDSVTALPQSQEPKHRPESPTSRHLHDYTPTPLSPIPENIMKLREDYRRSSVGSTPKANGFVGRLKSLKNKVIGKFKPKTARISSVPRDEEIDDPMVGGLPDTVTQRKPSRLSRSKAPTVYVPSGSAAEVYKLVNDRAPTPFTPTESPSRSLKGDKSLPPIPEYHGSPISFNTLANFDDPFVISSTPEQAGPSTLKAPARDSKMPEASQQSTVNIPANALNHRVIAFLLGKAQDEEQDAISKAVYRKRKRDALDAQVQAIKYQVTTMKNQIAALEEQAEAAEAEAMILAEVQEYEDGLEERWREKRAELERMMKSVGAGEM